MFSSCELNMKPISLESHKKKENKNKKKKKKKKEKRKRKKRICTYKYIIHRTTIRKEQPKTNITKDIKCTKIEAKTNFMKLLLFTKNRYFESILQIQS